MYRALLEALRERLTRKHLEQGCVATREDFLFEPYVPPEKTFLGRV